MRTENGTIFIYTEEFAKDLQAQDFSLCNNGKIIKHSKNIIDLLEVGDYVNGYKILAIEKSGVYNNGLRIMIYKNNRRKEEIWKYIQEYDGIIPARDDIKSIVTKEMMKSIEYIVK